MRQIMMCGRKQTFTALVIISLNFYISGCNKDNTDTGSETAIATTSAATTVGQGWATLNGTVNANDLETIVSFEFDTVSTYTGTAPADPDTVTGNTITSVSALVSGLKPNTTYNFRTKAVSKAGTSYGDNSTFTTTKASRSFTVFNPTLNYGIVSDIDGNVYKTITIGVQTWMAENLRTTKFNDGTKLTLITNTTSWSTSEVPSYSWYNNDSVSYGGLYNYYAVGSEKNLCPAGWHIPADDEWAQLINFLGGDAAAGIKLKETGTIHWYSTNLAATNESGFTAIPAGYRSTTGTYNSIRRYAYWWSSTVMSSSSVYCRNINYSYDNVERGNSAKGSGLSVRCVKN